MVGTRQAFAVIRLVHVPAQHDIQLFGARLSCNHYPALSYTKFDPASLA